MAQMYNFSLFANQEDRIPTQMIGQFKCVLALK